MIKLLLLPPAANFLAVCCGYLLKDRHPRIGKLLISLSLTALLVLSMPLFSGLQRLYMEKIPAITPEQLSTINAEAIVLLTASRNSFSPEYGGETVNSAGLERLVYANYIQQKTKLPLLIAGGTLHQEPTSLAKNMDNVLQQHFGNSAQWLEQNSSNTWENAHFSHEILSREDKTHVVLITHAIHMPRAVFAFEQAGFMVIPAPTIFDTTFIDGLKMSLFIPSASALNKSAQVIHELFGSIWYRIQAFFSVKLTNILQ